MSDTEVTQQNLYGEPIEEVEEELEEKRYRIYRAGRFTVKLNEDALGTLWEKKKKTQTDKEKEEEIFAQVQKKARLNGDKPCQPGEYDQACKALFEALKELK